MIKSVQVDTRSFQESDDGNTSYFGGTVQVGEKTCEVYGTDRSNNRWDGFIDELAKCLSVDRKELSEQLYEENFEIAVGSEICIMYCTDGDVTTLKIEYKD